MIQILFYGLAIVGFLVSVLMALVSWIMWKSNETVNRLNEENKGK
jgi:uncharacterized membrane protein YqjE